MAGERETRVRAYSGYRGQERPVCFWLEERQLTIKRILRRWHEEGAAAGGERKSCFVVEGEDGRTYRLCYHQERAIWSVLEIP